MTGRGGAVPKGAAICDAAAVVLVLLAVWIAVAGGGRYLLADVVVSFHKPLMFVYAAASILLVRHAVWPRPGALQRLRHAHAALVARPDLLAAVRAFLATRPAVFVIAFFAVVTVGLPQQTGFTLSPEPLANLPARFDAGWYGDIALDGYTWAHSFQRQRNIAFFPAMPALMRPLGAVFGMFDRSLSRDRRMLRTLWAGVAISLTAFLWALHYLVRLGRELIGPERAAGAAMLLAAYPFALYFNAPYTESLFLLSAIGACYHFRRAEWAASSCWGLLAGLTRPNGCLLSVPLAIFAAQQIYAMYAEAPVTIRPHERTADTKSSSSSPSDPASGVRDRSNETARLAGPALVRLLVASMPGLGMLAFTAYLYRLTAVWFAWTRSHEAWGRSYEGIGPVLAAIGHLGGEPFLEAVAAHPYNTLNALGVLFGVALTYPVFKRLGVAWGIFVLVNLVPPLFAGGVLSMGRLTSTLFPLFLALAALVPPRSVPAWAAAFGIAQGFCASLFFTWRELF